jgi:hypothetical protein
MPILARLDKRKLYIKVRPCFASDLLGIIACNRVDYKVGLEVFGFNSIERYSSLYHLNSADWQL